MRDQLRRPCRQIYGPARRDLAEALGSRPIGPLTKAPPAKIATWSLFGLGFLLAGGSRLPFGQAWWLGPGLILIGLSMLTDVLLPGGSQLSDMQIVNFRRLGVKQPQQWHRRASLLFGTIFVVVGLYLTFS